MYSVFVGDVHVLSLVRPRHRISAANDIAHRFVDGVEDFRSVQELASVGNRDGGIHLISAAQL